jgi:ABC-type spermidine/putrescine transport system permease subunit II
MSEQIVNKPKTDKRNGKKIFLFLSLLWLPISFILPYSFTHHMATTDYVGDLPGRSKYTDAPAQWRVDEARNESVRSGMVGVLVALAIFAMWRLDRLINKDRSDLKGSWMVFMLVAFAMLLWTVWTCAGHLMLRANDEIYSSPAGLPGLETE